MGQSEELVVRQVTSHRRSGLTADEAEALRQFAVLLIPVQSFLDRMARLIAVGSFVPGEREITVNPLGVVLPVTRDEIKWVIQRYLHGKTSGEELSNWAGLLLAVSAYQLPSDCQDDDLLTLLHDLALPLKEDYLDRDVVSNRLRTM